LRDFKLVFLPKDNTMLGISAPTTSPNVHANTAVGALESGAANAEGQPAAGSLMPEPAMPMISAAAEIAKLIVKSQHKKREAASISADAFAKAEDAADARKIEAKRAESDAKRNAGIIEGCGTIASGLGTMTGKDGWGGLGKASEGAAKGASAVVKHASEMHGLEADKAESDSKIAKREYDKAKSAEEAAGKIAQSMQEVMREINKALIEAEKAALLRL
jgi:hypothetical protein